MLANWRQSGLVRHDPFPVSAIIVVGCQREERCLKMISPIQSEDIDGHGLWVWKP